MKKERIFWGIFFLGGAVALIVNKLGLLGGDLNLWTMLLTILLAAGLIKSVVYKSMSGILFSIAFLCIIYAKPLGITALTPWTVLGAALLGSIGCSILFHPKKNYGIYHHGGEHFESEETVEGELIELSNSFASGVKYINSDDFKGANIDCSFGAMKVYFDNAIIQGGQAIVHLDVSFAGVELFVPKEWKVTNSADISFGGIDEKNRSVSTGTPVMRITGEVSFAGVTIIYI